MWYAIVSTDSPNSLEMRLAIRPKHLERLQTLQDEGRLLIAGPFPAIDSEEPGEAGFTGSLIVAEFDSREAAETWAAADPYRSSGVYESAIVKPYKAVFPR